jgi:tripartite-type tricarboxylate transporter receptor subunit TctC
MLALGAASVAPAQVGERAIKFILPVATASGVDTITRAASPALAKALGHPVIVDNQPGAGGIVGTQALVRAAPDGFTLSIVSNNHVIYPSCTSRWPSIRSATSRRLPSSARHLSCSSSIRQKSRRRTRKS